MEITFSNFDEFAEWMRKKSKHTEELEEQNYDLEKENMQLRSEIEDLKVERALLINKLAQKKLSVAADSEIENTITNNIPQILKGREQ